MTALLSHDLGDILDNYADAIEGGTTWRGSGTAYTGIPGLYSNDPGVKSGDDTPLTTLHAGANTTTVDLVGSTRSYTNARWVSSNGPGFWLQCTTSNGTGSPNLHEARKISAWDNTNKAFTVATAYTAAPALSDVFAVRQGFKRLANLEDIEDEDGAPDGFDRFFHLSALPGKIAPWFGSGQYTYETELHLRLRMCKFSRLHDWTAAILTNLAIIRSQITARTYYGSYVRALFAEDGSSEILKNDKSKVVVLDKYKLLYRVDKTFE